MNHTTTQISGYQVQIDTKNSQDGFRTTITSPEADDLTIDLLFQRAQGWSRTLATGNDNSVRCVRDGRNIVIEDTARKSTDQDIRNLVQYLQAKTATASGGGGENTGGEPALTG